MNASFRKRSDLTQDALRDIASRIKYHAYGDGVVRTISEDGQLWLVLADVLNVLGYTAKPSHIAKRLREGEVELKEIGAKSSLVNCVERAGLYSFALYSNDAQAMSFYRWAKKAIWGR